jgi:hypothetical protein
MVYDDTFKVKNALDELDGYMGGTQSHRYKAWPSREYQGTVGMKF